MMTPRRLPVERVPPRHCPACGVDLSRTVSPGGEDSGPLQPGYAAICSACVCITLVDERYYLRPMTVAQLGAFLATPGVVPVLAYLYQQRITRDLTDERAERKAIARIDWLVRREE
jgi:hypothetical protein